MRKLYHYSKRPNMFTFNSWEKRNWGGDDEQTSTSTSTSTPQFYAAPEYPEAKAAREKSWSTLQGWTPENQYGMIQPNWDDIYSSAAKKVNQYYFGSPLTGGGALGMIKSSAARRGVSESPTADIMKGRMAAEQAGQLGQISSDIGYKKALSGEQSRMNWLNSMMGLSQMKPAGTWGGTETRTMTQPDDNSGIWGGMSAIGGGLMDLYGANQQRNWYSSLLNPQTTQSSISNNNDWLGTTMNIGAGVARMFPFMM